MKKIFFIALISVFSLNLSAQGFKLGFTATPTFNWFGSPDNDAENNGTEIGFNYGLLLDYYVQDNYAIHLGLLHSFTGGNAILNNDSMFNRPTIVHKLQQVEIPIALKLHTNEIGSSFMRAYGEMGLNLGFVFSGKGDIEFKPSDSLHVNTEEFNLRDDNAILGSEAYKSNLLNVGLHVGAGIHYEQDWGTVLLGLYFNNGFLNVNNLSDYKLTPKNLGVRLGFYF